MDLLEINPGPEAEGDKQAQLVGGVYPFDIEGGVRLGVPEFLGFFQRRGEIRPLPCHSREDVVACSVQDAENRPEPVGAHVSLYRREDRNSAGHRCLITDLDLSALRCRIYLIPVKGQESLVCGYHILAVIYGRQHVLPGRAVTADKLDYDGYPGIGKDRVDVTGNLPSAVADVADLFRIPHRNPFENQPGAQLLFDDGRILHQQPCHSGTYGP
ncbi:MAG: hypothetical protein A4E69_02818 [Syntrophus sp. PtaB.Bin138]|nr:MAG: hypothetical protein A4E69_02818 [Syntrophus sp. PtaB.Bin138]